MSDRNYEFAYLVTTGVYDDYRVHGVFLDQADAEAVAARYNREQNPYRDNPNMRQVEISMQAEIEGVPLFVAGRRPRLMYNECIETASFKNEANTSG